MSSELTPQQVENYLIKNPNFLLDRTELLQTIELTANIDSGAIPLIERQAALLKERNQELRERLQTLVNTARDNDLLFEKTRNLVLSMLEATNIDTMALAMEKHLVEDFSVDFFQLFIFDTDAIGLHYQALSLEQASSAFGNLATSPHAICGELTEKELVALFGAQAERVKSAAVQPFQSGKHKGLLVLGSKDPSRYRSTMGTLFLAYVSDVASRALSHITQ